jgi:hypothetical protein
MKARPVKGLAPHGALAENAARIVRTRLEELRSFAPKAQQPHRSRAQHDMRIAAKRLRYVLEATEFCLGRSAQAARRRARDLQDLLGELHDCDVMLPRIQAHIEALEQADSRAVRERAGDAPDLDPRLAARARHRSSYRGLEVLAVYVRARRALLFDRFREFWAEQERTGTWDRLDRAMERVIGEARERRRAEKRAARAARELADAERRRREAAEQAARASAALEAAQRLVPGIEQRRDA